MFKAHCLPQYNLLGRGSLQVSRSLMQGRGCPAQREGEPGSPSHSKEPALPEACWEACFCLCFGQTSEPPEVYSQP